MIGYYKLVGVAQVPTLGNYDVIVINKRESIDKFHVKTIVDVSDWLILVGVAQVSF